MSLPVTRVQQARALRSFQKLEGHTARVSGIVYLPGGQTIMTCSYDGSLRVWNLENGLQIGDDWRDGESAVTTMALSPNAKKVVTGSGDGAVRLWDIDTAKVIGKLTRHAGSVKSLCWDRDGGRIVSGSFDGTVRVWDVESGEIVVEPIQAGYDVDAVSYSPDKSMIATGVVTFPEKEYIKIWDATTGNLVTKFKGHRYTVTCLAWTADGRTLISGSLGDSIRTWNTTTWQQITVLTGQTSLSMSILAIAIFPNDRIIASVSFDGTAQMWDLENGQPIGPPLQHAKSLCCMSLSPDGNLLATGCSDNNAYSWDISAILREPQVDYNELLLTPDNCDNSLFEVGDIFTRPSSGRRLDRLPDQPRFFGSRSPLPQHHATFFDRFSSLFRHTPIRKPSLSPATSSQNEEIPTSTSNDADAPLCSTCSALDLRTILLDGVPEEHALPLGRLTDILAKHDQCGLCHLIGILIRRSWYLDKMPDINIDDITCALYSEWIAVLDTEECADLHISNSIFPVRKDLCHRLRFKTSSRPNEVTSAISAAGSSMSLEIQLLREDSSKVGRTEELHGRRVGQNVDIDLLRRWIHICENEHRERCETLWWKVPGEVLPKFIRVVDVVRMAIVPAPRSCRYVALSYLWGGTGEEYRTTQANLKQRSRRGGLDISVLPVTIQDTIHVVRLLGERYLWIDALCIVQDDDKDKAKQIGKMDLVYGFSVFTIFAAGGTSVRDPLPGVRTGTRDPKQEIAKIQGLHLAVPLVLPRAAVENSEWNTRGWTYQEINLSRRRIFFTSHFMHFECVTDIFCEDIVAERINFPWASHPLQYNGSGQFMSSGVRVRNQSGLRLLNQIDMRLADSGYMTMVENSTRRKLTYESDIVNAITALINVMAKGFNWAGGEPSEAFRFGMPMGELELALVWQPAADAFHERRMPADGTTTSWPSWSWAAWRGAVQYGSAYAVFVGERPGSPPDIRESLVKQWHIVGDDGKLARQDVRSTGRTGDGAHWATYVAPKGNIDSRQLINENAPLRPGTLVFRTNSTHFNVEKADNYIDGDAEPNYTMYSILSDIPRPSTRIGRVLLPRSTPSQTSCEFIVLSRTSGSTGWFDDDILDEHGVLQRLGYDGCMFYVMAVRKMQDEERMQRLGVGVILDRAWLHSTGEQKVIFLG